MSQTSLEDMLFGPAIADRACGDCIACCVWPALDSPEFSKPARDVCIYCTGTDCGVYPTRPQVCRTFDCVWRRAAGLPPEARPDKLGLMFSIEREAEPKTVFENLYILASADRDPAELHSSLADGVIGALSRNVLPIFIAWDGIKVMVHPPAPLAAGIADPSKAETAVAEDAARWLKAYAPYARYGAGFNVKLPAGF